MRCTAVALPTYVLPPATLSGHQTIAGQAAFADWNQEHPGVFRKIILAGLPQ
jgi:hypothetical protein